MAETYDPVRDLATVLHAALRQGFWGPAARGAIERLRHQLGLGDAVLASDIEETLRHRMIPAARRAAALENVRYLAALPPEVFCEAFLLWQYEQPAGAARLRALIAGQEVPRHLEEARGDQTA
jgi:hypothetical protein